MVALQLFDAVLLKDDDSARPTKIATELVQSALEEIRHIENLDESLAAPDDRQFDRQTVALVRRMYEQWAQSAGGLLDRLAGLHRRFGPTLNVDALRDLHGRTLAMLSVPLDRLERDHQTALEGRGLTTGEARRELHLGTH